MAPTLRKRTNRQLTDITRQSAAQSNAREPHVPETKALTTGMYASGSVCTIPEDKENFMSGIAERAKQNRRQPTKSSWSPPKLSLTRPPGRYQRLHGNPPEGTAEMSIKSLLPLPLPTATTHAPLKRKTSFDDGVQPTPPKRIRSNSAVAIMGTDIARCGYGITSPSILTQMSENPLASSWEAITTGKRSSRCANPLFAPELVFSPRSDAVSVLTRAAAVSATRLIDVKLPVTCKDPARLSFGTASDGSLTLVDEGKGTGNDSSPWSAPAMKDMSRQVAGETSVAPEKGPETQTPDMYDHGAIRTEGISSNSSFDSEQPLPSIELIASASKMPMDANLLQDLVTEDSQPTQCTTQALIPSETAQSTPAVALNEHVRPKASTKGSTVKLSLSPLAVERAIQIIAGAPPVARLLVALPKPTSTLSPDDLFIADIIVHLERQSKWKTKTVAKDQARRILEVLRPAKEATNSEALFLSCEDAGNYLETNTFFPGPIFVDGAQPMELGTVENFLNEYYDDTTKVWIQDPSILLSRGIPHAREVTMRQLKERFAKGKAKIPWNCLELAAHVEDGLRPTFLNSEDCRLLTKLKIPSSDDHTSRRGFDAGYKEIEKWALLAQAGSLTSPHQDSHGYSTYITVNQGTVGFGWLSKPTAAQRAQWLKSPSTFKEGNWRYKILRPGHTVYFPNGTIHFVFRLHSAGDTLAFGGHVLRCSQIVSWVKTLIEERAHRDVTNEDITVSAPGYLERVARFVKQARRMGQEEKWGGAQAIAEFLRLKEKFMGM